ncbi:hypothetical protein CGRA01v4_02370 [Colletotrichum graminicola]|nr:hypothetical protein CGRA01v4_02370 [Colletotrichum graminicola]
MPKRMKFRSEESQAPHPPPPRSCIL